MCGLFLTDAGGKFPFRKGGGESPQIFVGDASGTEVSVKGPVLEFQAVKARSEELLPEGG